MAPPQAARPAAVRTAVPGLVGDMAPLGFFDPLGFSKDKTAAQVHLSWLLARRMLESI